MSLLREIQTDLMQEDSKIGPILLKLRFLASRLGSDVLEEWVKHESEGYPPDSEVPDYRRFDISYRGTFVSRASTLNDVPIPSRLIEHHASKAWIQHRMRDSIAVVDALLSGADGSDSLQIDASNLILLLQGKVYKSHSCISVTGDVSESSLEQLRYAVRTRMLELTIQLEKEIPAAAEITVGPMEKQTSAVDSDAVTQVVQQTILGNQTTIHSSGPAARISVNVVQGDVGSLTRSLIDGGIGEADARELAEIVASEEPESADQPFGVRAGDWFARNIAKAADGTWKAGMAVATKVATEAALKYWGLKP